MHALPQDTIQGAGDVAQAREQQPGAVLDSHSSPAAQRAAAGQSGTAGVSTGSNTGDGGSMSVQEVSEEEEVPLLDWSEVEDAFAAVVKAPKTPAAAAAKSGGSKQEAVIDSKRAYNINILMGSKIKIPLGDLRAAVISLDPRACGNEEVGEKG